MGRAPHGTLPALVPVGPEPRRPRWVVAALVAAVVAVVALVQLGAIQVAFQLAGLPPMWALAVLAASLAGSFVDVPVARLPAAAPRVVYVPVRILGLGTWLVAVDRPPVRVAVNLGGAVVPVVVSGYVVVHTGRWLAAALAVVAVALVVHEVAVPITGVGVVVPAVLPGVVAAVVACIVVAGPDAAAIAYVGAAVGTLIGADLGNARWVRGMSGGTVSIGGAGTFDGVFVSGVLAVLVAELLSLPAVGLVRP